MSIYSYNNLSFNVSMYSRYMSIPSVDTIYLGKGLTHNITPQRCSQTRGGGHAPVASRSPSSSTTIRRRKSSSCNERGRSVLAHVVTSDAEASYYFTNFEGLFSGKLVGVLTSLIGFSSAGHQTTLKALLEWKDASHTDCGWLEVRS